MNTNITFNAIVKQILQFAQVSNLKLTHWEIKLEDMCSTVSYQLKPKL